MKKLVISAILAGATLLCADETMQASMSKMENGLTLIQKGFLYNNIESINLGIKDINDGNELFGKKEMEVYLPKDKKHMTNTAQIASDKIVKSLKELKEHLDSKEYLKSHESYANVITACAACHNLVRSW